MPINDLFDVKYGDDPFKPKESFADIDGSFMFGGRQKTYKPPIPQDFASRAEFDLSRMSQPEEKEEAPKDLSWWKDEEEYTNWLKKSGYDTETMQDFQANRLYKDYIRAKAERPSQLGEISKFVGDTLGGIVGEVSDALEKVPVIGEVVKRSGSVFKFIGNLIDTPMNVVRGITTAIGSGNLDELGKNVMGAIEHGVTGGTSGEYFSFTDAALRNDIDKMKQGMTESEFRAYMDSDDYRQTKRYTQAGGLILDIILDPTWLIGAGEVKALSAFKGTKTALKNYDTLNKAFGAVKKGENLASISTAIGERATRFMKKSSDFLGELRINDKMQDLLSLDKAQIDRIAKVKNVDEVADFMGHVVKKAKEINLEKLNEFGSSINIYRPFSQRKKVLYRTPISLEPIKRISESFFKTDVKKGVKQALWTKQASEKMLKQESLLKGNLLSNPEKIINGIKDVSKKYGDEIDDVTAHDILFDTIEHTEFDKVLKVKDDPREILSPLSGIEHKQIVESKFIKPFANKTQKMFSDIISVPEMSEFLTKWHKEIAPAIRNNERIYREGLLSFMESEGKVRIGEVKRGKKKGELKAEYLEGAIPKRIENINDLAKVFQHDELSYAALMMSDEFKKFKNVKAVGKEKGFIELFGDFSRDMYLPTNFADENFLSVLYGGKKKLSQILSANKNDKISAWHEILTKVRAEAKKDSDKFRALRELRLENGKRSIDLYDARTINDLSEQGLIFRHKDTLDVYKGKVFDTNPATVAKRMNMSHELVGKISGSMELYQQGKAEGWLKPIASFENGRVTRFPKPEGWVEGEGLLRGNYVPEVYRERLRVASDGIMGIYDRLYDFERTTSKSPLSKAAKGLKHFNQWWKVQVTVKHFGFHARNFTTNRIMLSGEGRNILHGLRPYKYADRIGRDSIDIFHYGMYHNLLGDAEKANDVARATKLRNKIKSLETKKILMAGEEVNLPAAYEIFLRNNVAGGGHVEDIMQSVWQKTGEKLEKGKLSKAMSAMGLDSDFFKEYNIFFGTQDVATKKGRYFASYLEEGKGRNELFLHLLNNKGLDIESAGQRVNKLLVDYSAISKSERALKDYFMPFYIWQSRMVGTMLEKVVKQPAIYTKFTQLQNNAYKMLELDKTFAPEYEKSAEGIPILLPTDIGKFFAGKPMRELDPQFLATESFLPQSVVNLVDLGGFHEILKPAEMIKKVARGAFEYGIGNITPFLKLPIETSSNYSFFFKKQLQKHKDDTRRWLGVDINPHAKNILSSLVGMTKEVNDVISTFDKNPYTDKPYNSVWNVAFKNLVGMKTYDRDEIREVSKALSELEQTYRFNLRDMKNKRNESDIRKHAQRALALRYGIDIMKWYREFLTEHRDIDQFKHMLKNMRPSELKRFKLRHDKH